MKQRERFVSAMGRRGQAIIKNKNSAVDKAKRSRAKGMQVICELGKLLRLI